MLKKTPELEPHFYHSCKMRPALLFKKDFGSSVSCKIFTNTFFIENLQWLLLYSWKCARHWWNFMQYNTEVYFGPCQTSMMKSLRENCPKRSFFWSVFSYIWSVFRPNIGKYGPEKNSLFGQFSRSEYYGKIVNN